MGWCEISGMFEYVYRVLRKFWWKFLELQDVVLDLNK